MNSDLGQPSLYTVKLANPYRLRDSAVSYITTLLIFCDSAKDGFQSVLQGMSSLHSLNLSVSMLGSLPRGPLPDPVRALCIRFGKSSNSPSDTKEVHKAIIDLLDASPLMRCLSISYTDRV